MVARIEHLVTSGTFNLDGGIWDVDNNVWLVGDDDNLVVIDAVPALAKATEAPILLHPTGRVLWDMTHPDPGRVRASAPRAKDVEVWLDRGH